MPPWMVWYGTVWYDVPVQYNNTSSILSSVLAFVSPVDVGCCLFLFHAVTLLPSLHVQAIKMVFCVYVLGTGNWNKMSTISGTRQYLGAHLGPSSLGSVW
jgi:hypothetical protein